MVIFPYKHSYATQKLWENNISIFIDKKQILQYPFEKSHWEYPKLETKIISGQSLMSSSQNYKDIDSYEDLLNSGFQITISKVSGKFFKGQKVQYLLTRKRSYVYDLGRIPNNHRIEYDLINKKIRLIGKNSDGKWIYTERKTTRNEYKTEFNPFDYDKPMGKYEDYLKRYSPYTIEEEQKEFIIEELPVMKSEDNRLVCIPDEKDMPVIGYYGMRGSGKSIGMHGLADRLYHKWHKKIFWANDVLRETGTWCLEWNNINFKKNIERIGEISQPLPMVYIHPSTKGFKFMINNEVGFMISLPFKEAMEEYEMFLQGKKDWEFEKSGTYFRNLIFDDKGNIDEDGLLSCKSYEDIKDIVLRQVEKEVQEEIRGQIVTHKYIGFIIENEKVRYKLLNVLKDVCNTDIFNITNNIPPRWVIELPDGKHEYYPWIVCLIANLVPSLITSDLRTREFYPQYLRFIFDDLFKFQTENEIAFKNKYELYIFVDEIAGIVNDITKEVLNKIVREGRPARIGFCYASQNVDKVPDDIKLNTNYVFAFRQKKNQASLIARDFDLLNYKEKELIKLNKFECIGIGKFVLYDTDGNKEVINDEPVRGTILPSVSMHQAPKLTGEEE